MFSSFSNSFALPKIDLGLTARAIKLPSVEIYDVETSSERRARALKHLLKINHAMHSVIYHDLQFHNHASHILGSAYILGANEDQLNTLYEAESKHLEPWKDAPGEISKEDWREYLGQRNYQRAFIDFFEDELVSFGYDWKRLLEHYLYSGNEPLFSSLISGLGHSLIHLGYAYELNSQTVAVEALTVGACFYSDLHKYIDDPSKTRPSSYKSSSVLGILEKISSDSRLDNLFQHAGDVNRDELLVDNEATVLDHWNAWDLTDPKAQFEESQKAVTALLVATHEPGSQYDFVLVHTITSSHAVRTLLPVIPAKYQIPLVRQWLFFAIVAYITQLRPSIKLQRIDDYNLAGRDWKYVENKALDSKYADDAHYVKALRAMKSASETWGDESQYYLRAAVKLASEFDDWA